MTKVFTTFRPTASLLKANSPAGPCVFAFDKHVPQSVVMDVLAPAI